VAVTLERGHEHREKRLESLSTNAIGRLPEHDERLLHGLIIEAQARTPLHRTQLGDRIQDPDRMLAVVPGHRDEFVKDADLLVLRGHAIPLSDCPHQFLSNICAELLRHRCLRWSATAGSRFGEATAPAR
jgi:hypothetical protein